MKRLYLASASPRRRSILKSMGLRFRAVISSYHEPDLPGSGPSRLVRRHAEEKAMDVARRIPEGLVLGADTIVYHRGRVIGKPRDLAAARRILKRLQGDWHTVYSGVALVQARRGRPPARRALYCETTRVRLRAMDADGIDRYFRRVNPLDKAGAYAIQGRRYPVVERYVGSWTNAVGLPSESLARHLRRWLRKR